MGANVARRVSTVLLAAISVACAGDTSTVAPSPNAVLAKSASNATAWSEPVNFGPAINTQFGEHNPFLTKDGLSLYFTSDRPGGYGMWDLYVSHRTSVDAPWGAPENLGATVNSSSFDVAPYISRDGHWLYFASTRPGGYGALDMMVSWREDIHDDHAWQAPVNLGPEVNGPGPESPMSIHGPDFYFAKNPGVPGARFHIFASQMRGSEFGEATPVAELNSDADDRAPSIRFDGRELFLTSNRAGGYGDYDLWVSSRAGDGLPWTAPINLGSAINTPYLEVGPMITEDGNTLLFVSDRPGGSGFLDLYYSTRLGRSTR